MKRMIYNIDYFVYFADLPVNVHGVSEPNDDGTYTILLNGRISRKRQEDALVHEILHISLGHFDRDQIDKSRSEKEMEVHAILEQLAAS